MTIRGTSAGETIIGTSGDDVIHAGGGNDIIQAGSGDDIVCGGAGNDQLLGMGGRDVLHGQGGMDSLYGHGGPNPDDSAADTLMGGHGPDWINYSVCEGYSRLCPHVDGGDDLLKGGRGNDLIGACDDGQRSLRGGRGRDGAVFCSAVTADLGKRVARFESGGELQLLGIEDLFGSPWQTDTLIGDDGPNQIHTGFDGDNRRGVPDKAFGGGGDDWFVFGDRDSIAGGPGRDGFFHGIPSDDRALAFLRGGLGSDRFLLCFGTTPSQPADGADYMLSGGGGVDVLEFGFSAFADLALGVALCADFAATLTGIEGLQGSHFDDTLRGDEGDNQIFGGLGDDVLDGRGGHDMLDGGDGTDDCASGEEVQNCERISRAGLGTSGRKSQTGAR